MTRRLHLGAILVGWIAGAVMVFVNALGAAAGWAESGAPEAVRPRAYDPKGRRDPFVPLVRDGRIIEAGAWTEGAAGEPTLQGVLWDPSGGSIALINDQEVRVGQSVGPYRVMEIRRDAVVLSGGEGLVVLRLDFETTPSGRAGSATSGR